MDARALPMEALVVGRPPPLPPSPPPPSRAATRLYTQGVQASVRPRNVDGEHTNGGGAFSDVSTQAVSSYIDNNLNEVQGAEPSARTIADPEMINLAENIGLFSPRRLKAFAQWVLAPLVGSAVSVGACWFVWGRPRQVGPAMPSVTVLAPAAAAAPPPAPAPRPAPTPAARAAPVPSATPPASSAALAASAIEAPPPPASPPAPEAAERLCRARITSRPSGATVMLGDRRLGNTPLDTGEVPCATTFTLVRPRYSSATTALPDRPGSPAALFVKLNRPPAQLTLTSTPANAQFRINGNAVGQAPQSVPVQRYERVRIEAVLPGHRKWHKTVYVTAASTPITAALDSSH
jgi:hypothetical protein